MLDYSVVFLPQDSDKPDSYLAEFLLADPENDYYKWMSTESKTSIPILKSNANCKALRYWLAKSKHLLRTLY